MPFVPGTGSARLDETLELTAAAAEAGADAVLIITPYYARPTQEGLFTWYSRVAGEFPDLPVIAYNVPSRESGGCQMGARPGRADRVGLRSATACSAH